MINEIETTIDTSNGCQQYIYGLLGTIYPIKINEFHYDFNSQKMSHHTAGANIKYFERIGFGKTSKEALDSLERQLKAVIIVIDENEVYYQGKKYPITWHIEKEDGIDWNIAECEIEFNFGKKYKNAKFNFHGYGETKEIALKSLEQRYTSWEAFGSPASDYSVEIIPKGCYCFAKGEDGKTKVCPFWSINNDKEKMRNGHCGYLEKGDWENDSVFNLLWDQIKECGVNVVDDGEIL